MEGVLGCTLGAGLHVGCVPIHHNHGIPVLNQRHTTSCMQHAIGYVQVRVVEGASTAVISYWTYHVRCARD